MAPEAARGEVFNGGADVYAFGVTLLEVMEVMKQKLAYSTSLETNEVKSPSTTVRCCICHPSPHLHNIRMWIQPVWQPLWRPIQAASRLANGAFSAWLNPANSKSQQPTVMIQHSQELQQRPAEQSSEGEKQSKLLLAAAQAAC